MSGRPDVDIDVLVMTVGRPAELATTLSGLASQQHEAFQVVVSDQSDGEASFDAPAARAMSRVLEVRGHPTRFVRHLPRRGLAEHRAFLLDQATAPYALFLDDDVWLEPGVLCRLQDALASLNCGFVGAAVAGLSYLNDVRPAELAPFERWSGPVRPERITRHSVAFWRCALHNAANPFHLHQQLKLRPGQWCAYKIAWVGGCVLYNRAKLLDCGGFDFWDRLPPQHAGEDVAAQWRVMERYGGAGILPSGAIHLESPTTVHDRRVEVTAVLEEFR
ncbi:MAG: hypothetical protein QOE41_1195 [Mycobacterium sp.]|nr:hypothetical protein [Mycobacterium sp.]MDT5131884.1 hypothetical protein [Mycobacterium sp.]